MFDFKSMDMSALKDSLKTLKTQIDEQKKRVNFKAQQSFEDTTEQYDKLIAKKDTIMQDKQDVLDTIEYLN